MIRWKPSRGRAAKRTARLGAVVLGGWLALTLTAAGAPSVGPTASLEKMLGQRIMVGVPGTSADRRLLIRVRRGYVGAVILFRFNIVSVAQTRSLVDALQAAARAGGNPPLLVAVDQEGGGVQRFAGGPPSRSPPEMVAAGDPGVAYQEGLATGRYLRRAGVNMDLAPVVDVPTFAGAFIRQSGRAFSADPQVVARYAGQFARGLQAGGVAATAKHFPGVGTAGVDTDNQLDELRPTPAQVDGALIPYRALIAGGLDAVMLSTAGFPAYDGGVPAALSSTLARGWLRGKLGFRGLSITDALGTPTGHSEVVAGTLAAEAGADVLLYTDQAPGVLSALNRAARRGALSRAGIAASYQQILALKAKLAG